MADASRDTLRGLLIMDPRLRTEANLWAAESTGLTQAGRSLGRPATSSTTALRLEARGDSASAFDVIAARGGLPGTSLGVVWKQESESSTSYRGQDAPVAIRASEVLDLGVGGASYERHSHPDALTLKDGTIVTVNEEANYIIGLLSALSVRCITIDSSTGTVSSPTTITSKVYNNQRPYPFLIAIPREDGGERILCGMWVEDSGTGTPGAANLDVWFSDDSGASWSVYARSVLSGTTTIDGLSSQRDGINIAGTTGSGATGWDLRRCRAAYANGQILLMMHLVHHDSNRRRVGDFLLQWSSADLGATFTVVDEPTDLTATEDVAYRGGAPVVRARDGLFHVAYVKVSDSNYAGGGSASLINVGIQIDRLGAAVQQFTEVASGDSANPTIIDGGEVSQVGATLLYELTRPECALALLPEGLLAVYWRRPDDGTSGREVRCALCSDGVTFENWGSSMYSGNYGTVWDVDSGATNPLDGAGAAGNVSNYPREFVACGQGARVAFVTSWVLNGTTADQTLTALMLGGYHTQTLGATSSTAITRREAAVGWEHCWFGLHRPDYVRWTRSTTASPTVTFSADGMQIVTGATDADYYELTPEGNGLEGIRLRWTLSCAGSNTLGDYVAVRLLVRDGSNTLDVSIRYSSSAISVYDNHGASQLASESVSMTSAQEFELTAAVGSSSGDLVLYRRPASLQADNPWTTVADVAPSLASSAAAVHTVRFGTITAGITSAIWREFHLVRNNHTGVRHLSDVAITNPNGLTPVSLSGRWSELQPGAFVRAVDGPAAPGDAYSIPLSYSYGAERALPSVLASPSLGWRSTDETAQSLAVAFNAGTLGTEESSPVGDTWGIHLAGINWGAGTLEGYDQGTSSWVSITALDFTTGASFTRTGNVVELTSASLTQQVREGEWNGGWFDLGGGDRRRILHTRGGLLTSTGGTVRRPRLVLDSIDGTEAASGSGEVYPLQATVIVRNATSYAGIRVSIDAQSTPDGYFTVGAIIAGPLVVFGTDYSWGRILEEQWNVEMNEARGGQRMPYQAGPPRRAVEFAWTDGIDVTQIDSNDSDADYMLSTSTGGIEPVAYTRDVLYTVQGVLETLGGPLRPVVYLPAVAKGTPDSETLTGRSSAVYGRITSPIRLESILGDENTDEVWRLARMTIEEEV